MGRINKYLSEAGFCSRREADKLIGQGRVTINGQVASTGMQVAPGDRIEVDGEGLRNTRKRIYIAFNKPVGVTCTTDPADPDNIVGFIGHRERIFNIGRLDKDSEGLIFLTNDGDIVNKILRAGNNHQKEYIVAVDKPVTGEFLRKMGAGVGILGTVTLPCQVRQVGEMRFRITLAQGLNRQIRRMCEALGYRVTSLRRVRIMNITLDGIEPGQWRYFTQDEIAGINRLIEDSSGTEDASRTPRPGKSAPRSSAAVPRDRPDRSKNSSKGTSKSISKGGKPQEVPPGGRPKTGTQGNAKRVKSQATKREDTKTARPKTGKGTASKTGGLKTAKHDSARPASSKTARRK